MLNEYITLLPTPDNQPLSSLELRDIIESNVPQEWRDKRIESGQDLDTVEELTRYFCKLEAT